jgi:hypothetical protein
MRIVVLEALELAAIDDLRRARGAVEPRARYRNLDRFCGLCR